MTLALGVLLLVGCQHMTSEPSTDFSFADAGSQGCKLAKLNDLGLPELTFNAKAELTESSAQRVEKAYFSMGCFWGSEAMLASCPGVLHTRTGFTGGQTPDPSYSAIADHVETVEVSFDPELVSYRELLTYFWGHHNSRAKPIFRQYASAIFFTSKEQAEAAKAVRQGFQDKGSEDPILTAIIRLDKFYPAEQYHQKYYLQQDQALFELLPGKQKLSTRVATKLNALAGRAGERPVLSKSLSQLGIEPGQSEVLFQRAYWPTEG